MQKLLNYFLMLTTFLLCGGAFTSCSDDDEPGGGAGPVDSLEVNLLKAEPEAANFEILAKNIKECAYVVQTAESAEEPEQEKLFEEGTHLTLESDSVAFKVEGLKPMTQYVLYLVAKNKSGAFYKSTIKVDFETIDFSEKMSIKLVEAKAVNAVFELSTKNIKECAYMTFTAADAKEPTKDVLFAKGNHLTIDKDPYTFEVKNLEPTTDYVIYLIGKTTSDEFFKETLKVDFKTQDFTDAITVTETRPEGFSVHVKVPADVKARGNALRFTRGSLPYYNMFKMMGNADADMLLSNGGDERSTDNAKTYTFDEKHSFVYDEEMGEEMQIDNPIVAGEPSVFIAGEFSWGESMYGWGEGYYNPCFDYDAYYENMGGGGGGVLLNAGDPIDEDKYWNDHFHHRQIIITDQPEPLEAQVKIEQTALTPINAKFSFTPEEGVYGYCVLIIDDATFNDMIMPFLDNNKDYLQWFTTSFMAFNDLGAQTYYGDQTIELGNFIYEDAIEPGVKFQMLVTALGNENGTKQNFQQIEFVIPERTKEAPVLEINPISNPEGEDSPYEVWFNIKSVGKEPAAKVSYVANYEREMEYMFQQQGYDPKSLVMEKGNPFTPDEVMAINSEEGYNVRFDSRADATTYFVGIAYNDEGLESEAVLAKKRSLAIPAEPEVSSPYLTSLIGDWTAEAEVVFWDYETSAWSDPVTTQFKVNINNKVEYPETLSSDVYDLYTDKTKEEVDALYKDFKKCAADYAQRLKDHNCLVCTGFDPAGVDETSLQTPYDLFVSPKYSGFNNEAIFYDFGPKWIIRVNQDGTLSVPVNMNQMDPLSNWRVKYGRRNVFHLVGLGLNSYVGFPGEGQTAWPAFPVTVGTDNNSLTVEPMIGKNNDGVEDKFYPNAIEMTYQGAQPAGGCKVVSNLRLTKGWSEIPATFKSLKHHKYNGKVYRSSINGKYTPKARPAARTTMVKSKKQVKVASMTPMTYERAQKNVKATFNKMFKKLQKK